MSKSMKSMSLFMSNRPVQKLVLEGPMYFSCLEWGLASNIFFFSLPAGWLRYVWCVFAKFIALPLSAYLKDTATRRATSASPSHTMLGKE